MNQSTAEPTNKVAAAGIGGSVAVLVIWIVGMFGVQMPPEVAASLTAVVSFGAGYMRRERAPGE